MLEDGHITDAQGRKVSFKNTIIIMTSNQGAREIVEPKHLGFTIEKDEKADYAKMKDAVMGEVKNAFKPEFLNRIDELIVFHSLTKPVLRDITQIQLDNVVKRCAEQMNIQLSVEPEVVDFILEKGFDPKYGARPIRRTVQTYVEDYLAEEILEGTVKEGGNATLCIKDGKVAIKEKEI